MFSMQSNSALGAYVYSKCMISMCCSHDCSRNIVSRLWVAQMGHCIVKVSLFSGWFYLCKSGYIYQHAISICFADEHKDNDVLSIFKYDITPLAIREPENNDDKVGFYFCGRDLTWTNNLKTVGCLSCKMNAYLTIATLQTKYFKSKRLLKCVARNCNK